MISPSTPAPLPTMPVWLRALGAVICFLPPIVYVASLFIGSASPQEAIGSVMLTLIFGGIVFLFLLIPCLLPPLCWILGWRPGALAGSILLGLVGLGFSTGQTASDILLGAPLDLHFLLIGVLLWEWKRAKEQQRLLSAKLGEGRSLAWSASPDDAPKV